MGLIKLKDIKLSSVYITPNLPVIQTKRYKFDLKSILGIILGYTLFVVIVSITILAFTPAKEFIFFLENEELIKQADRIKELENEVLLLSRNLNDITATTRKLNFALILAATDSLDSTSAIYDSLKQSTDEKPYGGSILAPVKKLLNEILLQSEKKKLFLIHPANGVIINNFSVSKGHLGIDYGVKKGSAVYASAGGLVLFSGFKIEDGNTIMIQHNERIITVYKHCSMLLKKTRDFVSQGELIAFSGSSGYNSLGEHLHFEVWEDGKIIDPIQLIVN